MKIAINIDELFGSVPGGGGQGQVITNFVKELVKIDRQNRYTLFSVRPQNPLPEALKNLPSNFECIQISFFKPQLLFLAWHTIKWPPVEAFIGPQDIVHALSPSIVPACRRAKLILTVNDMVWWRYPQGLKLWGRFFQRTGLKIGADRASKITTISEATRRDVLDYLGNRVSGERVRTIYIGADKILDPKKNVDLGTILREKFSIRRRYALSIGTLEPRKNHAFLLKAFLSIEKKIIDSYQLIIIGAHGWKSEPLKNMIASLGLEDKVVWTGYLTKEEKHALLYGADLFIYPSLYEGFGIPILEAMEYDVPVITSNVSSMPEVAGDAAVLVNPASLQSICNAIVNVIQNNALRKSLIEKARMQRRRFSYTHMAKEFVNLYGSCWNNTNWVRLF